MTKRVFSAGFAWSVIESKWPGFEAAFFGFEPARLAFEPDEFWEGARQGRAHRPQRREDRLGARQCAFRPGCGEGAWQFRQAPRWMAVLRRGRPARASGQARRPPRREHGPDVAQVSRLGRLRRRRGTSSPACATPGSMLRRRSNRSATSSSSRISSTPGRRKPACPTSTFREFALFRSARTMRRTQPSSRAVFDRAQCRDCVTIAGQSENAAASGFYRTSAPTWART